MPGLKISDFEAIDADERLDRAALARRLAHAYALQARRVVPFARAVVPHPSRQRLASS